MTLVVPHEEPCYSGDGSADTEANMTASTKGTNLNSNNKNAKSPHKGTLGQSDIRCMSNSRILIVCMLFVTAGVAGGLTYYFTSATEQDDFEADVNAYAFEIQDSVHRKSENLFSLLATLAVTIQSYTQTTDETAWPFETFPHFQTVATQFRNVTGTRLMALAPLLVSVDNRLAWEAYSVSNQEWIQESYKEAGMPSVHQPLPISSLVYDINEEGQTHQATEEVTLPLWQMADPPKDTSIINFNLLSSDPFRRSFDIVAATSSGQLTQTMDASKVLGGDPQVHPESLFIQPISDTGRDTVAAVVAVLPWDSFLSNLYHVDSESHGAMVGVVKNTCGETFTYQLNGAAALYLGEGDLHDAYYDYLVHHVAVSPTSSIVDEVVNGACRYDIEIYPSYAVETSSTSNAPIVYTSIMVLLFFSAALCFLTRAFILQRKQQEAMQEAARSDAIVSSLFPDDIRERLFNGSNHQEADKSSGGGKESDVTKSGSNEKNVPEGQKFRLKSFLDEIGSPEDKNGKLGGGGKGSSAILESKPIADLFLNTTVLFADIAGFTAWSSVREPSQVFTLLETVYKAFDKTAKRRHVFKVETVGDCYVAVTGLPEPDKDHAIIMCRFARECLTQFQKLATQLEVILGPDTSDLAIRIGLHSGPVTAGVLRGDKSRFQLFGDTVNTAARVETTGQRNRIHISHETADLLHQAHRSNWMTRRNETIFAKGKGEMQTYWLLSDEELQSGGNPEGATSTKAAAPLPVVKALQPRLAQTTKDVLDPESSLPPRIKRLVDWNVDVLKRLLKQIVAKRNADITKERFDLNDPIMMKHEMAIGLDTYVLSEVTEIVRLPGYDTAVKGQETNNVELPAEVEAQLRLYVASIAAMYRDNPFHNFEHASHVMMSVSKLLSRIVAPDEVLHGDDTKDMLASSLHDHTYGITSDPLTQFSVVLSALIHDVDHCGVSNFQLIKEEAKIATVFKNKSVAEQNSIVISWDRLMESRFAALRGCIYSDPEELKRFRQLMVNTVMATDIWDKELQALRKARWDIAFSRHPMNHGQNSINSNSPPMPSSPHDDVNRRATIVIEHLIQASDVAHTMQHWHIYQKWNERLYAEMTFAYTSGRMDNNPSEGWYQGELSFLDNYVIPLAKKLKECGVFGVSSDEYLNYALENRREWASKGEETVAKMIQKYSPKTQDQQPQQQDQQQSEGK